jgi:hypothetical protein
MTASLTAIVDNVKFAELGSNSIFALTASGRRIRYTQAALSNGVVMNASVIRNVGTMTPTAITTRATLRI